MRILVHHDGQQLGPYTLEEARAALAGGALRPEDLAWQEGAPNWVPLAGLLAGAGGAPAVPGAAPQLSTGPNATQTSGLAIASLVLGITSIVFCLVALTGIPAVICGHMARARIRQSRGAIGGDALALTGLITGYAGVALTLIAAIMLAAVALPAFATARERALGMQSLNQARQIVVACTSYAEDHDGKFPDALEQLIPDYLPDQQTLADPTAPDKTEVGYLYYGAGSTNEEASGSKVLLMSKKSYAHGRRVIGRANGMVEWEEPGDEPAPPTP